MFQNFLLTYSVKAQSVISSDQEKAAKVRNDIAELTCWTKLEEVETTFSGRAYITGTNDSEKKSSAKAEIEEQFLPILKKHDAYSYDVKIYCAMMLEYLDKPFEFIIKN
ncbi:MAG: hypothetical protein LZT29_00682 [Pantoea stewartii]|uniref:hypothetical protein n=1 Tax=Pantoea stewartii TaxID=66269 RepID=UPI0006D10C37|nr:hypothetical protein [Pantoea stewartii]WHS97805.1 MAG: hypothetical protein LZT29_00682 [Pantoea stewartii]